MTTTSSKITVDIDADLRRAFLAIAKAQDTTVSQLVRKLAREYVSEHGQTALPLPSSSVDQPPPQLSATVQGPKPNKPARARRQRKTADPQHYATVKGPKPVRSKS